MKLLDWFDIHNIEHLKAYIQFYDSGLHWPDGFMPDNVEEEFSWRAPLALKMAKAWAQRFSKTEGGQKHNETRSDKTGSRSES